MLTHTITSKYGTFTLRFHQANGDISCSFENVGDLVINGIALTKGSGWLKQWQGEFRIEHLTLYRGNYFEAATSNQRDKLYKYLRESVTEIFNKHKETIIKELNEATHEARIARLRESIAKREADLIAAKNELASLVS